MIKCNPTPLYIYSVQCMGEYCAAEYLIIARDEADASKKSVESGWGRKNGIHWCPDCYPTEVAHAALRAASAEFRHCSDVVSTAVPTEEAQGG